MDTLDVLYSDGVGDAAGRFEDIHEVFEHHLDAQADGHIDSSSAKNGDQALVLLVVPAGLYVCLPESAKATRYDPRAHGPMMEPSDVNFVSRRQTGASQVRRIEKCVAELIICSATLPP